MIGDTIAQVFSSVNILSFKDFCQLRTEWETE